MITFVLLINKMTVELKIEGLSCGHCVNAVKTILTELDGVAFAEVKLPDVAHIEFDEQKLTLETIKTAINNSEIYKTN